MVSSKISELQPADALSGNEMVPVVQSGGNRRTTTSEIANMVMGMADKCRFHKNVASSAVGGVIFNDGLSYLCNKSGIGLTSMAASLAHGFGKRYFEVHIDKIGQTQTPTIGICQEVWVGNQVGDGPTSNDQLNSSWGFLPSGSKYHAGSVTDYASGFGSGSTVMVAVDLDADCVWFGSNGVWGSSGNPGAGTNPAFTQIAGFIFPAATCIGGGTITANFSGPFVNSVPAGFSAWDG